MEALINIFLISLFCNGLKRLFDEGMILHGVGVFLLDKLPIWLCKPLFYCCPCMASIWGSCLYFYFFKWDLGFYFIVLLSVCALNIIVWHFTELIIDIRTFIKIFIGNEEEENDRLNKNGKAEAE